ncbi:signal peptide protein, YSIRK family [Lentilactobacillus sp. IMAU92037]|uniref:signal peptide protein, YSIRK family n=1 Tax=Lentilactobacillus TaxID=2767893 RepID=UPI001C27D900|nr:MULTISPECIES: signal peptide protein, YSIRK family [Lentilactobacillus]MBU9789803.1 signal peptide protein, YSIRK family [Lentilactobacillus dabitei]MBV0931284.1 signal peptide protein, YSIRK family [Lentilactobacillus dabitei]MDM7517320.1 signal peptide protein, YSIRK family [Lentilactobacillus sp. TOM.63]
MSKFATVVASAILAAPFIGVAPMTASAAKTKSYKFAITSSKFFKKAATYHTKDNSVTVYKGAIGADTPNVIFTVKGKIKPSTTFKVDKTIKAKSFATKKTSSFSYVKGQGWVKSALITKGAFERAD